MNSPVVDVRRFLRRAQVRVLPQPTGRVAQLAEQDRCRQFPGGSNERQGERPFRERSGEPL
jgi:hypothetical protein